MDLDKLKYNSEGLLPVIVQDFNNGQVLMMAYADREALEKTIDTGKTHFWSRSRNKLWMKGEESGNTQHVKEMYIDCDSDTVLVTVEQNGAAALRHSAHQIQPKPLTTCTALSRTENETRKRARTWPVFSRKDSTRF